MLYNHRYRDVLLEPDENQKNKKTKNKTVKHLLFFSEPGALVVSPVPKAVTHDSDECAAMDFVELILATK